ncbi:ABC transporter substrate-binding protein [Corynebacterium durum]
MAIDQCRALRRKLNRLTALSKLSSPTSFTRLMATVGCATLMYTTAACVTNDEAGLPDGWEPSSVSVDAEAQALVPPSVAKRGTLIIGSNPPFAPAEFKDSQGTMIGFDIDLARAVAETLGLKLEVREMDFNLILPAVAAGSLDFGASGFTDNEERRKNFTFVNYLTAGIQWAARPDNLINPDDACGRTVAVQRGTVSDTDDVVKRSEDCVAQGKPPITKLAFESSDAAATALILGRADALSADSPVTAYAVARSDGKIKTVGPLSDAASYGWPVPKNSELTPALVAALDSLIRNGEYERIMKQWGIEEGLADQALVNGEPPTTP